MQEGPISKKQFLDWIENPTTEYYMSYLRDFRSSMLDNHRLLIEDGVVSSEDEQRLTIQGCGFLEDLSQPADELFLMIETHYERGETDDEFDPSMGESIDTP